MLSRMATASSASIRLSDPAGLSPVALGFVAAASLLLVSLALSHAFGWGEGTALEARFWRDPRGWFDAVLSILFGWAVGGGLALVRGGRRDLEALRPAVPSVADLPRVDTLSRRTLRGAVAGSIVVGMLINVSPGNWPEGFPGFTHPFFIWATLRTMLVAWAIWRTAAIAVNLATRFSQLGASLPVDDLLDLRPLAPLGRGGLRNVAVWVGMSALFAVMLIAPFGRGVVALMILATASIGVLAFLAPVWGARQRRVEVRNDELARVRKAVSARAQGAPSPEARWADFSLADLTAWEQRLEHVRTWPVDATIVLRFGLYVSIGLGSWIGAALVERALGAALD
jgi:hypothetical protein